MQRYFAKGYSNNEFVLHHTDEHHIKTVMRMQNNTKIEVVYENQLYIATVTINPFTITKTSEISSPQGSRPYVRLILPLLKEQKMDYILQKGTELGVNELVFVQTERTIVKIDPKNEHKKLERWHKICKEASEQSKRLDVPEIIIKKNIGELKNINGHLFVCSTAEKSNTIKSLLTKMPQEITFVVGPEGGLSIKEEEELIQEGFIPITLGSNIMRVETVPLYLLSVIKYEYME